MSKNNDPGMLGTVAILVALWAVGASVLRSVGKYANAFGAWLAPLLPKIFLFLGCVAAIAVTCFLIYKYVSESLRWAHDANARFEKVEKQLASLADNVKWNRSAIRHTDALVSEVRMLAKGLDAFTGYANHRLLEEKAKAANAEVTGEEENGSY